jgi:hypothetical protein
MRFLIIFLFTLQANAVSRLIPAKPVVESTDCILKIVAKELHRELKDDVVKPTLKVQGPTTVKEFQDSIEKFWKFRPEKFTNVFNPLTNEVFIMSERKYYTKMNRSIYDSIAHELTHYVQNHYMGVSFTEEDDSVEAQAIEIQTWFRETYRANFVGDTFVCPN